MSTSQATVEQAWTPFLTPQLHIVRRRGAYEVSAEDSVQDVFLKVHTHIDTLAERVEQQGWLYPLTRNAIVD